METLWTCLVIGIGSALGGMGRYWLSLLVTHRFGESLPWGTLVVNVSGSFLIGLFVALTGPGGRWPTVPRLNLFFATGVCGGYTTFSSFSLQTLQLAQAGHWLHAGANAAFSLLLCLLAVWLGYFAGQFLNRWC